MGQGHGARFPQSTELHQRHLLPLWETRSGSFAHLKPGRAPSYLQPSFYHGLLGPSINRSRSAHSAHRIRRSANELLLDYTAGARNGSAHSRV